MAYCTADDVRLSLRAAGGALSWQTGEFDDLLADIIAEASERVDDMCSLWSPFSGTVTEDRDFLLDGAARAEWTIVTDPFTAAPTAVSIGDTDITGWEVRHAPTTTRSGRDLWRYLGWEYAFTADWTSATFADPPKVTVSATWGWSETPPAVKLATIRMSAKTFMSLRNPMGIIELDQGAMYEPRYDAKVKGLLAPWIQVVV